MTTPYREGRGQADGEAIAMGLWRVTSSKAPQDP